jgi:hypothetical membrane protein
VKKIPAWLCLSGPLAAVFYFLHVWLGARAYPGYEWTHQAVSDLTAYGAPSYFVATRYASLYGSLSCLCAVVVALSVPNESTRRFRAGLVLYAIMNWISNIGYGLFPLSGSGGGHAFSDFMHGYVVTSSVVLLSIASMVLIAAGGIRDAKYRPTAILAAIALASMFAGSICMGTFGPVYFGIFERFSVFSVVIFTAALGISGFAWSLGAPTNTGDKRTA